jgi:hypothetical protein
MDDKPRRVLSEEEDWLKLFRDNQKAASGPPLADEGDYGRAAHTPAQDDEPPTAPAVIKATPFIWVDPASIPRRKWLYGRHYIQNFISQTVAPGALGKSSLAIVENMAIAAGLPLLGVTPHESVPVWYWNGEDPEDELQRRIISAALRHRIGRSELEGRLFVDTGRKTKIVIAEQTR